MRDAISLSASAENNAVAWLCWKVACDVAGASLVGQLEMLGFTTRASLWEVDSKAEGLA